MTRVAIIIGHAHNTFCEAQRAGTGLYSKSSLRRRRISHLISGNASR